MHLSQYCLYLLANFNQICQLGSNEVPLLVSSLRKRLNPKINLYQIPQAMPACTTMVLHTRENVVKAFT